MRSTKISSCILCLQVCREAFLTHAMTTWVASYFVAPGEYGSSNPVVLTAAGQSWGRRCLTQLRLLYQQHHRQAKTKELYFSFWKQGSVSNTSVSSTGSFLFLHIQHGSVGWEVGNKLRSLPVRIAISSRHCHDLIFSQVSL